jgi:hypothetical protein
MPHVSVPAQERMTNQYRALLIGHQPGECRRRAMQSTNIAVDNFLGGTSGWEAKAKLAQVKHGQAGFLFPKGGNRYENWSVYV